MGRQRNGHPSQRQAVNRRVLLDVSAVYYIAPFGSPGLSLEPSSDAKSSQKTRLPGGPQSKDARPPPRVNLAIADQEESERDSLSLNDDLTSRSRLVYQWYPEVDELATAPEARSCQTVSESPRGAPPSQSKYFLCTVPVFSNVRATSVSPNSQARRPCHASHVQTSTRFVSFSKSSTHSPFLKKSAVALVHLHCMD